MPESLHGSYTEVKSANIQKPWTQLSRTGSLTSVGTHVEQLEVLRGVCTLGASRAAQGFPRTLRPVPARARGGICRFSKGSAPSPCARAAARRTARGSPRRRGPLLRLRKDGPVAPGQDSGSVCGLWDPFAASAPRPQKQLPGIQSAGDAQWSGTSVSSLRRAASGSLLAPALPLLGGNWPSPQGRASQ